MRFGSYLQKQVVNIGFASIERNKKGTCWWQGDVWLLKGGRLCSGILHTLGSDRWETLQLLLPKKLIESLSRVPSRSGWFPAAISAASSHRSAIKYVTLSTALSLAGLSETLWTHPKKKALPTPGMTWLLAFTHYCSHVEMNGGSGWFKMLFLCTFQHFISLIS